MNNPRDKKQKKEMSLLLGWVRRFNKFMTPTMVGWIWATNSILALLAFSLTHRGSDLGLGIFFFSLAVLFWNRASLEVKK